MRRYTFPAKRDDIDKCYDVEQLTKWKREFEQTLEQMELDFGGFDNLPERLYKYRRANQLNLKQIEFKIRKLTGPVTSVGALKCFHDTAKEIFTKQNYEALVEETKKRIGKTDTPWEELIKKPHK